MGEPKISDSENSTNAPPTHDLSTPNPSPQYDDLNFIKKFLPVFLILGLALIFYGPFKSGIDHLLMYESTDDANIDGHVVTISSKVGGVATQVLFDDHASVKKGDLLVQLDQRELANTVKQMEADLVAANAVFKSARREFERGEFDNIVKRRKNEIESDVALLSEAKSDLDRGEFDTIVQRRHRELESGLALLNDAHQTLRRVTELKSKNLISDVEYDTAKTNYENNLGKVGALRVQLKETEIAAQRAKDAAEAKFKSLDGRRRANQVQLREALNSSELAHDAAEAKYQSAMAKVWSIEAQLDQAKLNLEYTQIRAPTSGVVSKRLIEVGMVVRPNQSITTLTQSEEKWVMANFKETQIKNIYVGQPVEIEIDAIENKIFNGVVQSISPGSGSSFALIPSENATGNFTKIVQRIPVKIEFVPESIAGNENLLISGLSVNVRARIKDQK